jgi:arabinofuranosyltransferase
VSRADWLIPVLAVAVLLGAAAAHANLGTFCSRSGGECVVGTDDAYISFRYAQNIFRGDGAVFNPGERVEGYSNPLLVLLTVPGFFVVSASAIYWWVTALNAVFMAASLLVLYGITRTHVGSGPAAGAAFVFALCPVLWTWVGAGLETPMVVLLQLTMWALTLSPVSGARDTRLMALAATAVLARPDGFLVPMIIAAHEYWRGHRTSAQRLVVAVVVATVVITGWRWFYYGEFVPNTYFAKVAGPMGDRVLASARQLLSVGGSAGLLVLLSTLGALPFLRAAAPARLPVPLSTALMLGMLAYWAYVGGDVFDERFLVVLFPIGIFEVFRLLSRAPAAVPPVVTTLALVVILASPMGGRNDDRFTFLRTRYDMWLALGEHLRGGDPTRLLAIDAAGKVPYVSGLRTLDLLGLTDPTIARTPAQAGMVGHKKYAPDYVFAQQPDLIAAWIVSSNLDLAWGLTRERYRAEGYTLTHLVNASRVPQTDATGRPANVIDVTSLPDREVVALLAQHYRYAVLTRR